MTNTEINTEKQTLKEAFIKYGLEEEKKYSKEALNSIYDDSEDYINNNYEIETLKDCFDCLEDCYTETDDKENIEQYTAEINQNKINDPDGTYWSEKLSNSVLFCSIPSHQ